MLRLVVLTAPLVFIAACESRERPTAPPIEPRGGSSGDSTGAGGAGGNTGYPGGFGGSTMASGGDGGPASRGGRAAEGGAAGVAAEDAADQGGLGGGSEQGGQAGELDPVASELHLGVGFNLELRLDLIAPDPIVLEAPGHGTLRSEGNSVVYTPPWAWLGSDTFTFETSNDGVRERKRVTVWVEAAWLVLGGTAYRTTSVTELDRVFDLTGDAVFGEVAGRGARIDEAGLRFLEYRGAPAFLRRELASGRSAGYADTPEGAVGILFAAPSFSAVAQTAIGSMETRWFGGDESSLVGQARGGLFAEDRFQALRCDRQGLDCLVLSPDVHEDGRALFVYADVTFGSIGSGSAERACVWSSSRCDVPVAIASEPSRLVGRDRHARLLANLLDAWGYPTAATLMGNDSVARGTFPTAYGVELTGLSGNALVGSLHGSDGRLAGLIGREIHSFPPGVTAVERPEPDDASVRHACLHTIEGPFSALAAVTDVALSPVLSRTHVSYSIQLPASGSGWASLSVPREGDYSLFLDSPTTLSFENAASVTIRALRSSHCARITWIHELRFSEAGTFRFRLSNPTTERVALVLEAGHAFAWPDSAPAAR